MKPFLLLAIWQFVAIHSFAQYWPSQGGRSSSLAGTGLTLMDPWSAANNQACMAFVEQPAVALAYHDYYALRPLSIQSVCAVVPTRFGVWGIKAIYSGDANLNNFSPALACAIRLSQGISAGASLDLQRTSLGEGYGSTLRGSCEFGVLIRIDEALSFGAHIFNPVMTKLTEFNDEKIPTVIRAGFGYHLTGNLLCMAEIHKTTNRKAEIRSGLEYNLNKSAFARMGLATGPFRYSVGFGIKYRTLSIDAGSGYHPSLGFSPALSIQYQHKSYK